MKFVRTAIISDPPILKQQAQTQQGAPGPIVLVEDLKSKNIKNAIAGL